MSTGLTWVSMVDNNTALPEFTTSPVVFSDYSEAYKFCDWWTRILIARSYQGAEVIIWTTSPNPSGYWTAPGGVPTFNAFE